AAASSLATNGASAARTPSHSLPREASSAARSRARTSAGSGSSPAPLQLASASARPDARASERTRNGAAAERLLSRLLMGGLGAWRPRGAGYSTRRAREFHADAPTHDLGCERALALAFPHAPRIMPRAMEHAAVPSAPAGPPQGRALVVGASSGIGAAVVRE